MMVCFAFGYFISMKFQSIFVGVGYRVESHPCKTEQVPGCNDSSIMGISFLFGLHDTHHLILIAELIIVRTTHIHIPHLPPVGNNAFFCINLKQEVGGMMYILQQVGSSGRKQ